MENLGLSLNQFFCQVFEELSKAEETFLAKAKANLSPREFHLVREVCCAVDNGRDNRATAIAAAQHVTAGTLTSCVTLLERKGYLERRRDTVDRRVVRIFPTDKARDVQSRHNIFQQKLASQMAAALREDERGAFLEGLKRISSFFSGRSFEKTEMPAEQAGE